MYHGVPMLCVPLFGDQSHNANTLKVFFPQPTAKSILSMFINQFISENVTSIEQKYLDLMHKVST